MDEVIMWAIQFEGEEDWDFARTWDEVKEAVAGWKKAAAYGDHSGERLDVYSCYEEFSPHDIERSYVMPAKEAW